MVYDRMGLGKHSLRLVLVAVLLLGVTGCPGEGDRSQPETLDERVGYAIGLRVGQDFRAKDVEVDPRTVLRGLEDGLENRQALMTDQEIQEALKALQKEIAERREKKRQSLAAANLQDGLAFLQRKGNEPDVTTLPSGLLYRVLRQGAGKAPDPTDRVTVHYLARLRDGTEFDSSYSRKKPVTLSVSQAIPGWREALLKMHKGGKWRIFLPPELAYGEQGAGSLVGPNEVLIYEIELLEIGTRSEE